MEVAFIIVFISILLVFALIRPYWGFILLFALIPFHALLVTSGNFFFALSGTEKILFAFWKEILLAGLLLRVIFDSVRTKKFPIKFLLVDYFIFALFILTLVTIIYGTKNWQQALWGVRYDFEMFLIYITARSLIIKQEQFKMLLKVIFITLAIVSVFGIIQALIGSDFMSRLGYGYSLVWSPDQPLQASQVVAQRDYEYRFLPQRIISTLAGPNQLAGYLVILQALLIASIGYVKKWRWPLLALLFLSFVPLFFTYSRAAWLALAVLLMVLLWIKYSFGKSCALLILLTTAFLILVSLSRLGFVSEKFNLVLLRPESSSQRIQRLQEGINIIKEHPFGIGVGKAGLVTMRFPENGVLITESWHLQILDEFGWLGFGLYFIINILLFIYLIKVYKKSRQTLGKVFSLAGILALSGMIVYGFLLHTWADIVMTFTTWSIIGFAIRFMPKAQNKSKKEIKKERKKVPKKIAQQKASQKKKITNVKRKRGRKT